MEVLQCAKGNNKAQQKECSAVYFSVAARIACRVEAKCRRKEHALLKTRWLNSLTHSF